MSAKISVIICSYNYARFLPQCLQSVISQSRPADEIILIDDGSTDETPAIAKAFPQVRYFRQNNAGKAVAFNRGFCESHGDILCHLDADDYWLPEKLASVTDAFGRTTAGGLFHDAIYVDGEGRILPRTKTSQRPDMLERIISLYDALVCCFIYPPPNAVRGGFAVSNTICVRREAVEDCFPLAASLGLGVDGALIFSSARRGLLCLPGKLSAYRHHGGNNFVSDPKSTEYQRRLYQWLSTMSGVTPKDRRLLHALTMEMDAHLAAYLRRNPIGGAFEAARLLPELIGLGLVPHWKHLALPVASLIGWRKIGRARPAIAAERV